MGSLTINPAHRSELFTVKIHQGTIFNARNLGTNKCIAGFFTGPGLGISCEQIFEDLKILYPNLKIAPQGYRLALWAQEDMEISIYHEGAQGADLVLPTPKPPREWLGVMFHHPDHWRCSQAKGEGITGHVEVGCAIIPPLDFNPDDNGYMPYDTIYGIPTARLSRPTTPSKRPRSSNSSPKSSLSAADPAKQDANTRSLAEGFPVSTRSFEEVIKQYYRRCVITQTDSKFGSLLCGPGYVAAHIIPQKLWYAYPDSFPQLDRDYPINVVPSPTASGGTDLQRRMTDTWDSENGIVLRADVHDIFDKRLIAIHPVTFKVRVFAPMAIVAPYHGQTVDWGPRGPPGKEALAYHYQQTVLENVGARFTLRCKISTRNKWSDSMNKILQSELPSIPTITEDIEPGGDGAADGFEDAWRPRLGRAQEEEIRSWLEKYDV